jgi:hypothetical protein
MLCAEDYGISETPELGDTALKKEVLADPRRSNSRKFARLSMDGRLPCLFDAHHVLKICQHPFLQCGIAQLWRSVQNTYYFLVLTKIPAKMT